MPIQAGSSFIFGNPEVVFEETYRDAGVFQRAYDVSPDGKRFLMIKEGSPDDEAGLTQVIVVQNWLEELKRLVPVEN